MPGFAQFPKSYVFAVIFKMPVGRRTVQSRPRNCWWFWKRPLHLGPSQPGKKGGSFWFFRMSFKWYFYFGLSPSGLCWIRPS